MWQDSFPVALGQNASLRRFVIWTSAMLAVLTVVVVDYFTTASPVVQVTGAYFLPIIGLAVGRLALPLGLAPTRSFHALFGVCFLVGGTLFDLGATFLHSPQLDLEGNPAVRILLDLDHSLPFVYGYIIVTHGIFAWTFATLWLVYLNHCPVIVTSAGAADPHTWWQFFKAATGGGHLTWRQWAMPLRIREMPTIYYWVWPATVTSIFAATIFRWYAGLEWFDVVKVTRENRCIALSFALIVPLAFYVLWLFSAYGKLANQPCERPAS